MKALQQILLVDDDPTNNFLNQELLQELRITNHIQVLTNGKKGLDYLLEHCPIDQKDQSASFPSCPELVIFDHYMPVMDGMEMIQALHQQGFMQKANIVFILLGIHTSHKDWKAFQALGVQEFTPKPLSKEVVMEAYRKYFTGDTARKHT